MSKNDYYQKYKEIELIGTATLVLCNLDKKYYISKKINMNKLSDKEKTATFREVDILKTIKHPHIVKYQESFTIDEYFIIIMEYCEEGDLGYHIKVKEKKNELFPEKLILNWFLQIVMAVEFIHNRKILHRDLKTTNVFLTANKSIKLGDFGIAKVLENTQDIAKTLVGTPYYLSPEICQNQPYTYKSDVWALGCLLYQMCTLKYPFQGNGLMDLLFKIIKEDCPQLPNVYSNEINSLVKYNLFNILK